MKIFCTLIFLTFYFLSVESYFDVLLDRFEVLFQDEKFMDWKGLKVKKVNKTRSLAGEIKFLQPLGNDVIVEGKALKKQGKLLKMVTRGENNLSSN